MLKSRKTRIILSISLVGLVIGLVLWLLVIRKPQELRKKAAGPGGSDCGQSSNCIKIDFPQNSGSYTAPKTIAYFIIKAGTDVYQYPGNESSCYTATINQNYVEWEKVGPVPTCHDISHVEIWMTEALLPTETPVETITPVPTNTPIPGTSPTPTTASPTPITPPTSPTPTPEFIARCDGIFVYDTNWNLLSTVELNLLQEGDVVRFATSATVNSGAIDKVRFTINNVLQPETILKKPGTNIFYFNYTMPANLHEFSVKAELHHTTQGWF